MSEPTTGICEYCRLGNCGRVSLLQICAGGHKEPEMTDTILSYGRITSEVVVTDRPASTTERITGVAIQAADGIPRSMPIGSATHYRVSIELFEPSEQPRRLPSGFVTNTGRFVGRREAYKIAVAAGQIDPEKTFQRGALFAEDFFAERAAIGPPSNLLTPEEVAELRTIERKMTNALPGDYNKALNILRNAAPRMLDTIDALYAMRSQLQCFFASGSEGIRTKLAEMSEADRLHAWRYAATLGMCQSTHYDDRLIVPSVELLAIFEAHDREVGALRAAELDTTGTLDECRDALTAKERDEIEALKRVRELTTNLASESALRKEAEERADAISNAGHAMDCVGSDPQRGVCGCGWLQRFGAHTYITKIESELADLRAKIDNLKVCGVVTGAALDRDTGITEVDVCENDRPCAEHPPEAWLTERNRADAAEEFNDSLRDHARERQRRTTELESAILPAGVRWNVERGHYEEECCPGCHTATRLRDCGCPCGTAWRRWKPSNERAEGLAADLATVTAERDELQRTLNKRCACEWPDDGELSRPECGLRAELRNRLATSEELNAVLKRLTDEASNRERAVQQEFGARLAAAERERDLAIAHLQAHNRELESQNFDLTHQLAANRTTIGWVRPSHPCECTHIRLSHWQNAGKCRECTCESMRPKHIILRRIDPKFHIDEEGRIVKTSSGEVVPEDEPLHLFRGRDRLALATLNHYRYLCVLDGCNDYQLGLLDENIQRFADYASDPSRMKQPGVTKGAAWVPGEPAKERDGYTMSDTKKSAKVEADLAPVKAES